MPLSYQPSKDPVAKVLASVFVLFIFLGLFNPYLPSSLSFATLFSGDRCVGDESCTRQVERFLTSNSSRLKNPTKLGWSDKYEGVFMGTFETDNWTENQNRIKTGLSPTNDGYVGNKFVKGRETFYLKVDCDCKVRQIKYADL